MNMNTSIMIIGAWLPRMTLLDDAAHLMSPLAREVTNLVMLDGADLGKATAGSAEGLIAYEKGLFPRSASATAEAERNLRLCFGENAPRSLLDLFSSAQLAK